MNRKLTVMLLSLMTLTFSSDIANLPSDVEPNVAMPRSPTAECEKETTTPVRDVRALFSLLGETSGFALRFQAVP